MVINYIVRMLGYSLVVAGGEYLVLNIVSVAVMVKICWITEVMIVGVYGGDVAT